MSASDGAQTTTPEILKEAIISFNSVWEVKLEVSFIVCYLEDNYLRN